MLLDEWLSPHSASAALQSLLPIRIERTISDVHYCALLLLVEPCVDADPSMLQQLGLGVEMREHLHYVRQRYLKPSLLTPSPPPPSPAASVAASARRVSDVLQRVLAHVEASAYDSAVLLLRDLLPNALDEEQTAASSNEGEGAAAALFCRLYLQWMLHACSALADLSTSTISTSFQALHSLQQMKRLSQQLLYSFTGVGFKVREGVTCGSVRACPNPVRL